MFQRAIFKLYNVVSGISTLGNLTWNCQRILWAMLPGWSNKEITQLRFQKPCDFWTWLSHCATLPRITFIWVEIGCKLFFKGCHHPGGSFIYWAHISPLKCSKANVQSINTSHTVGPHSSGQYFWEPLCSSRRHAVRNTVKTFPEPICLERVCCPSAWLTCSCNGARLWFLSAAPGVPKWSPIQALSRPNAAQLQCSNGNWCFQHGMVRWLDSKLFYTSKIS